jgi:HAD superfamily hydrolase (TIGR01509 family)
MAESIRWLHDYTGELFDGGLPWCDGAQELLEALAAERTPMALVTNTQRQLTERALNSIGKHYFSVSVCGDEVPRGKPAPDAYRRAATLLGLEPGACLAVEDSVTGTAAAESAGCPVLVVPNDVEVPAGRRRAHVSSLTGVGVADLRQVYDSLSRGIGERSA